MAEGGNEKLDQVLEKGAKSKETKETLTNIGGQLRSLDEQIDDLSKLEKKYIEKLEAKFKEFDDILVEIGNEELDESSRGDYLEIQRSLSVLKAAFDDFKQNKGVDFEDKVATLNHKILSTGRGLINWHEERQNGVSPEDFKAFFETIPDGSLTRENIDAIHNLFFTLYHFCQFFGNGSADEVEWKIQGAFSRYMGDFLDIIAKKLSSDLVFNQGEIEILVSYKRYMTLPKSILSHFDENSKNIFGLLDFGRLTVTERDKPELLQRLNKVEDSSIYSNSLALGVFNEMHEVLSKVDLIGSLIDKFKDDSFSDFESWRYTIAGAFYSLKEGDKEKLLKRFKPKARSELQELFYAKEFTSLTTRASNYNDKRYYNNFSKKTENDLWALLSKIPDGSITDEYHYLTMLSDTQRYPSVQKMVVLKFANYDVSEKVLEEIFTRGNRDVVELFLINYKNWTPEFFTKTFLTFYPSLNSDLVAEKVFLDIIGRFPDGSVNFDCDILSFLRKHFEVSEYSKFIPKLNQENWVKYLSNQGNFKHQSHPKASFQAVKYPDEKINDLIYGYSVGRGVFDVIRVETVRGSNIMEDEVTFKGYINSRDELIEVMNRDRSEGYTLEVREFILQLWDKYQKPLEDQQKYIGENLPDSLMKDPNYIVNLFIYERPNATGNNKPLYEGIFNKHSAKELAEIVSKGYQMRRNQLSAILAGIPYNQNFAYLDFACELMKSFPDQVNKKTLLSVVSNPSLNSDARGYLLIFLDIESLELNPKVLRLFFSARQDPVVQHLMITVLKKMPYISDLKYLLSKEFFVRDTWAIFLADRLSKEFSNIKYFGKMMDLFSDVKAARDILMENFRLHTPVILEHRDEYGVYLSPQQEEELKESRKTNLPFGCNELCASLVVPYRSTFKKPFLEKTTTLEEDGLDEKMKNLKVLMNTYANPPSWLKSHEVESFPAKFMEVMNDFNYMVHSLYMLGEENPELLKKNNIPKNYYETVAVKFLDALPAEGYYFLLLVAKNNITTSSVLMPTVFEDHVFPRFKKHLESFEGGLVGYLKKVDPSKKYWNEFVVYLISVGKIEEIFPEKKEDQQFIYDILFDTIQTSSNNIYTDLKNSVNNCHFVLEIFNSLSNSDKYRGPLFERMLMEFEQVKVNHDKYPDDGIYSFNYIVLSVGIFSEYLAHVRPKIERKEELSDLDKRIAAVAKEFEIKYLKYIEVARDVWLAEVKNEKKEVIQPKNVLRTIYYFWDKPQMGLTRNMLKAMGCVAIKVPECFGDRAKDLEAYEVKTNGVSVQYILDFQYDHVADDVKNNRADNYSQRGSNSKIGQFFDFKSDEKFYSFIGGCGSAGIFPQLSSKFLGAVFVGVLGIGNGGVNDVISHYVNVAIANGKKRWDEVQSYVIETLDQDLASHKDIRTSDVGKIITKTHAKPYDEHKLKLFQNRYYKQYRYPHEQLFLNVIKEFMNGSGNGTLNEGDLD